MDFYTIKERNPKKGTTEVYPDFKVGRSKDLMVRAKSFYAVWDEERGMWSTDEYDVQRLVDIDLLKYQNDLEKKSEGKVSVKLMLDFSNKIWIEFKNYLNKVSDNSSQLDCKLTFANTEVKKKDHVSKRLPYPLEEGPFDAWDEILGTLYEPAERAKIEWAIGSIVAGDAKDIQKFIVLYGEGGSGKSTILNIIQKLFEGYYTTFEAKALTSMANQFSTEVFRSNPLVAIQHDGDLSRIDDNTKLNSIISHEDMVMNEKHKPSYTAKANCFLFMATNKPVKITDAKSGIIRRLIDVKTSGRKIPTRKYYSLMSMIDFELGAIAYHCLTVYRGMGKNYYSTYVPLDMMFKTDVFFNFVEENFLTFKEQDGVSLAQAYQMYKNYCDEALVEYKMPKYKFKDELKNYFETFSETKRIDEKQIRNYYTGFISSKFTVAEPLKKEEPSNWLNLEQTVSLLDSVAASYFAQYASDKGTPLKYWKDVITTLSELDTTKLHFLLLPINHIVIDFDLKDEKGEKSTTKNLEAASKWPPTYAEFSKSGSGLHLHYYYEGDVDRLSSLFDDGIEIKVFRVGPVGPASLRRKLSRCNNIPIAKINSGLPLKEEKLINFDTVKSEKGLRSLIIRNLNKEIHAGTKPSIDFIATILDEAYKSGLKYDVTDMRQKILVFAVNSSHQAELCVKTVSQMQFKSEESSVDTAEYVDDKLVFFDTEVYENLFVVCWKYAGPEFPIVQMVNPGPSDMEQLFKLRLIGFNNRKYDNHILYARYIGYSLAELQQLSQRIVGGSRNAMFSEAYGISYTDVLDFTIKKQSLKAYQVELGIHHQELGIPWDKPVPEELWPDVVEYCKNDVRSLEAVFNSRKEDFVARQILADLSGLTVNDTTSAHAAKIIFGNDQKPQDKFVYTDLSKMFPGYKFEAGKSTYGDEEPGEGGYVYAKPGYYENVVLLDVASMHPTSIEKLNLFGPYTAKYSEIKAARVAIKHKDYDAAKNMLDGKLVKHLASPETSASLSNALKLPLNQVYGLTFASFPNKFKDPRNIDNVVAKRGALFMIELKRAVQATGAEVIHIKTDSIKIANASPDDIAFVMEFGHMYGYDFENEGTFDKFFLANEAVYIGRYSLGKKAGCWDATGAQFAHPYVFKTLFSKEPIVFEDMCEVKAVSNAAIYLDMNEDLPADEHRYQFVGKTGLFCPILPGRGGGLLLRESNGKYNAVTGSKGYRWLEAEKVKLMGKEEDVDLDFCRHLVDQARKDIGKYVDFDTFIN